MMGGYLETMTTFHQLQIDTRHFDYLNVSIFDGYKF